eukprot:scaffold136282_cov90-Phaeocystis_antarctica.AAC.1
MTSHAAPPPGSAASTLPRLHARPPPTRSTRQMSRCSTRRRPMRTHDSFEAPSQAPGRTAPAPSTPSA